MVQSLEWLLMLRLPVLVITTQADILWMAGGGSQKETMATLVLGMTNLTLVPFPLVILEWMIQVQIHILFTSIG